MSKSDARSWGNFGAFAATHRLRCEDPIVLRTTIGWFPSFLRFDTIDNWLLRGALTVLYQMFPALFGAKILYCPHCQSMAFYSDFGEKLYDFLRTYIYAPEEESMLFFEPDVESQLSEEDQKRMELEAT